MLLKYSFLIVLGAVTALSQTRIGNGGNVVDCSKSIQVLDLYEMDEKPKLVFEKSKSYQEVAEIVLKRLKEISTKLGTQYSERLVSIEKDIEFKEGIALSNTMDSLHIFKPEDKECEIKQTAIRREVTTSTEKKFVIDKKLWNRLDDRNKAALLIHEIVYEHFNKLGQVTSVKVRKVVGLLFQEKLEAKEFWNEIKVLKLPVYPD